MDFHECRTCREEVVQRLTRIETLLEGLLARTRKLEDSVSLKAVVGLLGGIAGLVATVLTLWRH